jgi:hypothetical protein
MYETSRYMVNFVADALQPRKELVDAKLTERVAALDGGDASAG